MGNVGYDITDLDDMEAGDRHSMSTIIIRQCNALGPKPRLRVDRGPGTETQTILALPAIILHT